MDSVGFQVCGYWGHGFRIGLHKRGFLEVEAGTVAVNMMKTIKQALDPHNILNPGKIFQ